MTYSVLPLPYQWDGSFTTEAQLIIGQYQDGARQNRKRHRIRNVLDKASVTVFAADFVQIGILEEFLITPPGRLFRLFTDDTRLWRCMSYEKSLSGSKGETIFTLQLMQVYKP